MQDQIYKDLIATEGSYEDFVELIYDDIDEITTDILTAVEYYRDLCEVKISHNIWMNLKRKWPTVQKDGDINGNVDISITLGRFVWLAEAKIWGGPNKYGNSYLFGGYTQLTERYSKCQIGATSGAMLIFIKPNNNNHTEPKVMDSWTKYLSGKLGDSLISLSPCKQKSSCIYSVQPHSGTEYKYTVRHIPITLLHNPKDKSAKDAEKYKAFSTEFESNLDDFYED
ncbi:hypothetical protein [Acinetobacter piscicola]|uniref:hypothetical protein n=1 Tax=Acinetobacter piscicola TaxID=2006115 RepID=UPI00101F8739|nr:hypothetical protein [Acinetobacter piscicola]RYL25932.1 hypothetical protein EWP19_10810 [Acinetobacter piscicola]